MSLGSLLIFVVSIFNFASRYREDPKKLERLEEALRRFGNHRQIDLKYYQQEGAKVNRQGIYV